MAGTGHPYEILNIDEVLTALSRACEDLPDGPAKKWFSSKIVLKHVTGPTFTVKLAKDSPKGWLSQARENEKPFITKKLREGGDIRFFSLELLTRSGVNLRHSADWLATLADDDPVLKKLTRMDPITVQARADEAIAFNFNPADLEEGEISHVLTTVTGRKWFELKDEKALIYEGARMDHCVGKFNYPKSLKQGLIRIYSLRTESGKPLVTAEYVKDQNTFRQILRASNQPIGFIERRDLCELLNNVGNINRCDSLDIAGLDTDEDGNWRLIEDTACPVNIAGYPALSLEEQRDRKLFLLSAKNPDTTIAIISPRHAGWRIEKLTGEWWEDPKNKKVIVTHDDAQIGHIDDQRYLAGFLNALVDKGMNPLNKAYYNRFGDITSVEGRFIPFMDTLETRSACDIDYLKQSDGIGEQYLLPATGNKARIIATGTLKPLTGWHLDRAYDDVGCRPKSSTLSIKPSEDITITPAVMRRIAKFMNAVCCEPDISNAEFNSDDSRVRSSIRWAQEYGYVYAPDYTAIETLVCGSGEVHRTPWSVSFKIDIEDKKRFCTVSGDFTPQKELSHTYAFNPPAHALKLLCEELNERNTKPSPVYFRRALQEHSTMANIVYVRDKWQPFESVEQYLKTLKGRRKTLKLDIADAECALAALGNQPHPLKKQETELQTAAVLTWAAKAKLTGPNAEAFLLNDILRSKFTPVDRIKFLAGKLHQGAFDEKELKAVKRVAEGYIKYLLKLWGRKQFNFEYDQPLRDAFTDFFDILSPAIVTRCTKKLYHDWAICFFKRRHGNRAPIPIWIDRLKNMSTHPHKDILRGSALRTVYELWLSNPEELEPGHYENWIALFRIIVENNIYDNYHFERGARDFIECLEARAEKEDNWKDRLEAAKFIADALEERFRLEEERKNMTPAEWQAAMLRSQQQAA